tara:strand:- start:953 stop:1642 length:690 start_codon:yes stop_codon:yes gene_type:complete
MSKDPAFLFYSSDFLTGTMFLTDEQIGKFIKLLCIQHQKGRLREKDMLKICKTYDEDVFEMFKQDEENLFYNDRLEVEVNKRKAYSESRRNNRKKKTAPLKNTSLTYVKHMENENENENENKKEDTNIVYPFETIEFKDSWRIWKQYKIDIKKPYKSKLSEQGALKRLSKMATSSDDAIDIIEFSIAQTYQGLYKENKTTNNGRKNNTNSTAKYSADFKEFINEKIRSD